VPWLTATAPSYVPSSPPRTTPTTSKALSLPFLCPKRAEAERRRRRRVERT
jgi:hypothetical protein